MSRPLLAKLTLPFAPLVALVALAACQRDDAAEQAPTGSANASLASSVADARSAAARAAASVPDDHAKKKMLEALNKRIQGLRSRKPVEAPKDVAAPPASAKKTPSGLAYVTLKAGTGNKKPAATDGVKVHYSGWTKDGKNFDSSVSRGKAATFGVGQVIPGWTEGLQTMVVGEKKRFWIPAKLAYGETPKRPGTPAGQLTFDVELLEILEPPPAPKDVAAPPADARKTPSGLAYKVIKKGAGGKGVTARSFVRVHYSGWTKDGKLFDSSRLRGEPSGFPVTGVIPGWTEGLQLMREGDQFRFWIPAKLAYGESPSRPGTPAGQLTFDVELVDVR